MTGVKCVVSAEGAVSSPASKSSAAIFASAVQPT
jgi:hypothetical protein